MADKIQTMIPRYGELNRIYRDYIDNRVFSFDRQKFISDFCQEYNDMKSFEAAILELVLDKQKEQYTLILRYDSIGYREHTAEEEKQAEKEYERCKAEYDKERAKLNELYDQQKAARKEAFQYMKNRCADMYRQSCLFLDILKKYIPDGKRQDEPGKPISQQETADEQQEYFSMKLLSLIHEVCVGEQFEEISAPDFYANMNLHPCNCKLRIKPREKIRVCYLIFLMSEKLSKQDKDKWKAGILKLLDIDDSYYKSKYKEPVSDFPSDSNQKFAKEMEHIFR